MMKIAAGFAGVVLCAALLSVEPSLAQTASPGTPGSTPLVPSQQAPASQLGPTTAAPPDEAAPPTSPAHEDASQQQNAQPQRKGVASHQRHEVKHHRRKPHERVESYVTPWSGPYVIERIHDDNAFVLEGRWFQARSACPGWEAGERVRLRVGPQGECALLNRTRHRACAISCDGQPGWDGYR